MGADAARSVMDALDDVEQATLAAYVELGRHENQAFVLDCSECHEILARWVTSQESLRLSAGVAFGTRTSALTWPSAMSSNLRVAAVTRTLRASELTFRQIRVMVQTVTGSPVQLVEPQTIVLLAGERFPASRKIESILQSITKSVELHDPYVSLETLDLLLACPGSSELRVLTREPIPASFVNHWRLFAKDRSGPSVLRTLPVADLAHDRFLIFDDAKLFLSGGSLKDSGGRLSTIVQIGVPYSTSILAELASRWANGDVV